MDENREMDMLLIKAYLKKLDTLASGLSHESPVCGVTVIQMRQSGHNVYLEPCGYRLWQGLIPDYWNPKR